MEKEKLTLWQRIGLRKLRRDAGRKGGEPLTSEDWGAYYGMENSPMMRAMRGLMRALPSSPRCGRCGAPFAGFGRFLVGPLGYKPSRKNPTVCASCVETSPPGGMTMRTGVLFADIRGFTSQSESSDPEAMSRLLRRFYRCAEDVLFPDAIIDKLIGDEVMALYLPDVLRNVDQDDVSAVMLEHARGLLRGRRLRQRGRALRRDGRRDRRRRGVRRQHRRTRPLRLHGGRRRRQHRLAPPGPGGGRRGRPLRPRRRGPAGAARASARSSPSRGKASPRSPTA